MFGVLPERPMAGALRCDGRRLRAAPVMQQPIFEKSCGCMKLLPQQIKNLGYCHWLASWISRVFEVSMATPTNKLYYPPTGIPWPAAQKENLLVTAWITGQK